MISTYDAGLLADIAILSLGAMSTYVIMATGQISLGNAGFAGIGAYLTSWLTAEMNLPITPALAISALASAVAGVAIGFPALRLMGIYLTVATLAFGEMVRSFFLNLESVGGAAGFHGMPPISLSYIWGWTGGVLLFLLLLERSRLWLDFRAVNDDETAAGLIGINTTAAKLTAFALGASIAGIAGGLFAHHHLYIEPGNFGYERSVEFLLAAILGGSSLAWGALLGSGLIVLLPEWLRFLSDWRLAAFGTMLVLMLLLRPQGLLTPSLFSLKSSAK